MHTDLLRLSHCVRQATPSLRGLLENKWNTALRTCLNFRRFTSSEVALCIQALQHANVPQEGTHSEVYRQLLQQAAYCSADMTSIRDLAPIMEAVSRDTYGKHPRTIAAAKRLLHRNHATPDALHVLHSLACLRTSIPFAVVKGVESAVPQTHPRLVVLTMRSFYELREQGEGLYAAAAKDKHCVVHASAAQLSWLLEHLAAKRAAGLTRDEERVFRRVLEHVEGQLGHTIRVEDLHLGRLGEALRQAGAPAASLFKKLALRFLVEMKTDGVGTDDVVKMLSVGASAGVVPASAAAAFARKLYASADTLSADDTRRVLKALKMLSYGPTENPKLFDKFHRNACRAMASEHVITSCKVELLCECIPMRRPQNILTALPAAEAKAMTLQEVAKLLAAAHDIKEREANVVGAAVKQAVRLVRRHDEADMHALCSIVNSLRYLGRTEDPTLRPLLDKFSWGAYAQAHQVKPFVLAQCVRMASGVAYLREKQLLQLLKTHVVRRADSFSVNQVCRCAEAYLGSNPVCKETVKRLASALTNKVSKSSSAHEKKLVADLATKMAKAGVADTLFNSYRTTIATPTQDKPARVREPTVMYDAFAMSDARMMAQPRGETTTPTHPSFRKGVRGKR